MVYQKLSRPPEKSQTTPTKIASSMLKNTVLNKYTNSCSKKTLKVIKKNPRKDFKTYKFRHTFSYHVNVKLQKQLFRYGHANCQF